MSDDTLIQQLGAACAHASDAAAGARTALVSIAYDRLSDEEPSMTRIETRIVRATRTLVFSEAEAFSPTGARVMSASAVRKVL